MKKGHRQDFILNFEKTRACKNYFVLFQIFFAFLSSVVVPLVLCSARLLVEGFDNPFSTLTSDFKGSQSKSFLHGTVCSLGVILAILIAPLLLTLKEAFLRYASKSLVVPEPVLTKVKYQVSQYYHALLGIESHAQITIIALLLFMVNSETRTIVGLEVMFKEDTIFFLPTQVALVISITWSLFTCVLAHFKGIEKKRVHSTKLSKITILIFSLTSIFIRVFTYVMYFTPILGLLNCLRHLQGENFPFDKPFHGSIQETFYFGNATPIPWKTIDRWTYHDYRVSEAPNVTLYTYFSLLQYNLILMMLLFFNIMLHLGAKRQINPELFNALSWIDVLIHGISCCSIPLPMHEWDEDKGTKEMHKKRSELVWKEMLFSILINFGFNLILLSPLIILGINVSYRHSILINSIGALPQEIEALHQIQLMIGLSYTCLLVFTLVQVVCYYFYNGKCHPFAAIILPAKETIDDTEIELEHFPNVRDNLNNLESSIDTSELVHVVKLLVTTTENSNDF